MSKDSILLALSYLSAGIDDAREREFREKELRFKEMQHHDQSHDFMLIIEH